MSPLAVRITGITKERTLPKHMQNGPTAKANFITIYMHSL